MWQPAVGRRLGFRDNPEEERDTIHENDSYHYQSDGYGSLLASNERVCCGGLAHGIPR